MCYSTSVVKNMTAESAEWDQIDSAQVIPERGSSSIHLATSPNTPVKVLSSSSVPEHAQNDGATTSFSSDKSRTSQDGKFIKCVQTNSEDRRRDCVSVDSEAKLDSETGLNNGSGCLLEEPKIKEFVDSDDSSCRCNVSSCHKCHSSNNLREDDYFKPLKRLRMINKLVTTENGHSTPHSKIIPGLKSFFISDILTSSTSRSETTASTQPIKVKQVDSLSPLKKKDLIHEEASRFIRPWDTDEDDLQEGRHDSSRSSSSSSSDPPRPASSGPVLESLSRGRISPSGRGKGGSNPLDALFKMTSKTFDGTNNPKGTDKSCKQLGLFNTKQAMKRKRKSRTAFSNHQLFELEKRFLYQKYLSPADRDELSQGLGLTNAQVITWFQNRRAKLKRDMDELKKEVHSASLLGDHTAFIKTMTQMGILRNKPVIDPTCLGR